MNENEKGARLKGQAIHCRRARFADRKWMLGLALIGLLLATGGASLVAAVPGDGSDLAPAGEVAAAPVANDGSSWMRVRKNLSGSADVTSGYPAIATDSSGDHVAVVWTEGYDSSAGAKHHGRVYLRWVSEGTGQWSPKIAVDDGSNSENDWATDATVTLEKKADDTVAAHVVWVRVENNNSYSVRYCACVLGGSCDEPTTVLIDPTGEVLASPDIAVDSSGKRFVVWMRKTDPWQAIDYVAFDGSTWLLPVEISQSDTYNDWPVVTVKGDTVYTAWIKTVRQEGKVMYHTKSVGGAWSGKPVVVYAVSSSRYPYLVTDDSTVYLGWETFLSGKNYRLRYKSDDGSGWQPPLTNDSQAITDTTSLYRATTEGAEYRRYLRPALALGSDRVLHAVWHHNYYVPPPEEGDPTIDMYRVLYSSSVSPTLSSPTWSEPVVFATLSADEQLFTMDNVAARIAVGPPRGIETTPHVHVVLMLKTAAAWDVWYLSNQRYSTVSLPVVMKNY